MSKSPKPYDRQSHDTDKSWAAFCVYRDMGSDRTIEKLRIEIGQRSVRHLEKWSSDCGWVERCRQFDADQLKRQSIALQKLRLERRLEMEKDAWDRREKYKKKASQMLTIPITQRIVNDDGSTIINPTDKWSLKDAIALDKYADELGILATGGEVKKLDELEALTVLVDCGWFPPDALVRFSQGIESLKLIMQEAFEPLAAADL
ncbi:hypothetical protein [Tumidithrix helvetica]|uniref:hypothetical protein n=1 Tax=Tumidithrix helvetica TaxID=3457545 RepID=UPI003CC65F23